MASLTGSFQAGGRMLAGFFVTFWQPNDGIVYVFSGDCAVVVNWLVHVAVVLWTGWRASGLFTYACWQWPTL
jgi:hypothetical protein